MDVAISGASGFIGSALTASLRADGHRVLRLTRGGVTSGDAIGWNPDAGRIDAPALEGVDAVVHLAGAGIGEHRWTTEQKRRIRESRVRGTAVLAGAVASRERKPQVFVSGSAIGYYGNRGDEVLTEQSGPGDDFLSQVCVAWEAETQPASDAGVRTVLVRTGIVLDTHGGVLARMLLPFKLGIGGRQGSGKQWMSWIALADEVGAIRHAIDHDSVCGPVNLVAPNPVTNDNFARSLGHALHRPTMFPTPLLALKLRFGTELVESLLLASQRVAPAQLVDSGYEFTSGSLEAGLQVIFEP
ncbi:MAG: TIGR01777 family oxidoreductase [Acidimicrobiia bacterium]